MAQDPVAPTEEAAGAQEVKVITAAAVEATTPAPAANSEPAQVEDKAAGGEKQEEDKEASFSQSPPGAASCNPPLTTRGRSPSAGGVSADGSVFSAHHGSSCK